MLGTEWGLPQAESGSWEEGTEGWVREAKASGLAPLGDFLEGRGLWGSDFLKPGLANGKRRQGWSSHTVE